jgi:hypothetical protein
MWKKVLACSLFLICSCLEAEARPSTPVADAVKNFCFQTGARPDAVQKAVEAVGGKQSLNTNTIREWSLTDWAKGRNITLHVVDLKSLEIAPDPDCVVIGYQSEDASIEALKAWMGFGGIAGQDSNGDSYWYRFEADGAAIKELSYDRDAGKAANEGRCWTLSISRFKSATERGTAGPGETPDGQVQASLNRCLPEPLDADTWQVIYPSNSHAMIAGRTHCIWCS